LKQLLGVHHYRNIHVFPCFVTLLFSSPTQTPNNQNCCFGLFAPELFGALRFLFGALFLVCLFVRFPFLGRLCAFCSRAGLLAA
jgi:hypothetical protein